MNQTDQSKLRLMVVDDELDNLDLLYRTFRRDFQVFRAESALKALQTLEQEGEMAIIISDQRMPKMSGIEFLSRTVEKFPDTIRIVLTGYTDVEDLVSAINTGKVFKYITKPWNPDELKTVVQQAAETYRVLKQRTNELTRALQRESLFNAVTTAIRESLDYRSMLQTIAETIGRTFAADICVLRPVAEVVGTQPQPYRLLPDFFSYAATNSSTAEATLPQISVVEDQHQSNHFNQSNQSNHCSSYVDGGEAMRSALESRRMQIHQTDSDRIGTQIIMPLTYQQDVLAVLTLHRQAGASPWLPEEIELLEGVAEQAALAVSQAKLYQRIQQQTEQMWAELAVARQIQSNLLRQKLPDIEGVKVQACCYPAREVGGDFFEVFVHPQGDLWLAVGDVSGKGVPAALFMASAISVLRRELAQEALPEPNQVMQNLNSSLLENLVGGNYFITMVLARYSPTTRQLVYANAGHIYPLVWSRQLVMAQMAEPGTTVSVEPTYLKVRGVPLGILPTWRALAGELTLKPGEVLLLASDGITEATVSSAEEWSPHSHSMLQQTGLWQLLLQEEGSLNLENLLAQIQSHNQVQEDDQTILSLEVL